MATLIPALQGCLRRMTGGERRFAERLEAKLEDDYRIWYDVPVGESRIHPDFLVLHPSRGLLVLEVKDWKLSTIEEVNKTTFTLLVDTGLVEKDNPFEQARKYAHQIVDVHLSGRDARGRRRGGIPGAALGNVPVADAGPADDAGDRSHPVSSLPRDSHRSSAGALCTRGGHPGRDSHHGSAAGAGRAQPRGGTSGDSRRRGLGQDDDPRLPLHAPREGDAKADPRPLLQQDARCAARSAVARAGARAAGHGAELPRLVPRPTRDLSRGLAGTGGCERRRQRVLRGARRADDRRHRSRADSGGAIRRRAHRRGPRFRAPLAETRGADGRPRHQLAARALRRRAVDLRSPQARKIQLQECGHPGTGPHDAVEVELSQHGRGPRVRLPVRAGRAQPR